MNSDTEDSPTPEYQQMQEMIANNQRELDQKTRQLGEERLQFIKSEGFPNWQPEYNAKALNVRASAVTAGQNVRQRLQNKIPGVFRNKNTGQPPRGVPRV